MGLVYSFGAYLTKCKIGLLGLVIERLQEIDAKWSEYTKMQLMNNDTEVVRENIKILVEAENYNMFFGLLSV